MNPDTKAQVLDVSKTLAIIAAVTIGGVLLVTQPPKPKTITLYWDVIETSPGVVTEVWASTNLSTWTLRTNVAGTNRVTLPADKAAEFFKVRNRLGSQVSDWARKY